MTANKFFAVVTILLATTVVRAQEPFRRGLFGRRVQWVQAQPMVAQAPVSVVRDPNAFMAWLNRTRASYGLGPVGYDANLESWAAVNNSHQAGRGLGHYVMGPARRQNSAWNSGFPGVEAMWMNSPGHRSALLDPTIRRIGIAWTGAYATFNAY